MLSLIRSARLPTRQRLIPGKGLIPFLNLPDEIKETFWGLQSVCGFPLRGYIRKVRRSANSTVKATKESYCDVKVRFPSFGCFRLTPIAIIYRRLVKS